MQHKLSIITSVTNDLSNDQRVKKVSQSLINQGHNVLAVGRQLHKNKNEIKLPFPYKLLGVWPKQGPLFYFFYNIHLFLFIIRQQVDVLIANDLDTLLANYWAAKWKKIPLIYDSHEYFTEVPELAKSGLKKKIWLGIEKFCVPKVDAAITVGNKIAAIYEKEYNLPFEVIRNFPLEEKNNSKSAKQDDPRFILYQGAINKDRGLKETIEAFSFIEESDLQFWIAGLGDELEDLQQLIEAKGLGDRVKLLGHVPMDELKDLTVKASIGLSVERLESLNYRYALPNKVFDYIHAGVPVLYSPFEELKLLLKEKSIGQVLVSHSPVQMASQIQSMLQHKSYSEWVSNCKELAVEFSWEKEEVKLIKLFNLASKSSR